MTDLAYYLGVPPRRLKIFAREHGLMHWVGRGCGRARAAYVTDEGAMRLIAVFRTRLGEDIEKNSRRAKRFL